MNVKEISFEQLAEKYEPLLKSQIKKLYNYELYDELYQIALIALWDAQKNFDPEKGFFPGYAKQYVRGRLLTYLKKERKYEQRVQTCLEPELLENIPEQTYENPKRFPVEKLKPLLTSKELIWFNEFYEHNQMPTAIAKKYNVTVDQVKHWRKQTLKKIENNFRTSELLYLFNLE
ncbi:hypothetical protein BKP35_05190 [Anaerobacillus arseniciselenatis]|uniref:RNA polymerase sigma-70 region 2 domain-containing protein n=1 Tax=Anaerobacillus arseniciselenatis TaxID=85682 RepID=A0A1S2LV55_9BACI|nr:sigma-70 family RNA polymerase sigma factor [Anaerobacillus arseniciselenatis]OIJ15245.1 hypothetical protein BKP35_05190 [Anaerobacillus arseniciselenatis]